MWATKVAPGAVLKEHDAGKALESENTRGSILRPRNRGETKKTRTGRLRNAWKRKQRNERSLTVTKKTKARTQ